ncbi:hypothetical protein JKP88DRAFT_264186 [Tribonema minus]|uniref:Uncharacterized protein n=1 Tax=Tribonema minus TaxID=303371 RepID=A0A836CD39_9STRA|nr:hypothetical protein JKP88DRAFT_264186 [Tribonema minus]
MQHLELHDADIWELVHNSGAGELDDGDVAAQFFRYAAEAEEHRQLDDAGKHASVACAAHWQSLNVMFMSDRDQTYSYDYSKGYILPPQANPEPPADATTEGDANAVAIAAGVTNDPSYKPGAPNPAFPPSEFAAKGGGGVSPMLLFGLAFVVVCASIAAVLIGMRRRQQLRYTELSV